MANFVVTRGLAAEEDLQANAGQTFSRTTSTGGSATYHGFPWVFAATQAGADIGAQILAAHNSFPAGGGVIDAGDLSGAQTWSTNVTFTKPTVLLLPAGTITMTGTITATVPIHIIGKGRNATIINYTPTTGTVVTFNTGVDHSNSSCMEKLQLNGPGLATSTGTGILFGGTNGDEGTRIVDVEISGFQDNILWTDKAFFQLLDHVTSINGTTVFNIPTGLTTGTALSVTARHCLFGDDYSYRNRNILVAQNGCEVHFLDCEFDSGGYTQNDGTAIFTSCHIEDVARASTGAFFTLVAGTVMMTGTEVLAGALNSYGCLLDIQGGSFSSTSCGFYSSVTQTALAKLDNAAVANFLNVVTCTGFTSVFTYGTWTGMSSWDYSSVNPYKEIRSATGIPYLKVAKGTDDTKSGQLRIGSSFEAGDVELATPNYVLMAGRQSDGAVQFPQAVSVVGQLTVGPGGAGSSDSVVESNAGASGQAYHQLSRNGVPKARLSLINDTATNDVKLSQVGGSAYDWWEARTDTGFVRFKQGVEAQAAMILATHYANLGTPTNGTIYYCDDCNIANPCTGGGTGAIAKRLAGAWVCN